MKHTLNPFKYRKLLNLFGGWALFILLGLSIPQSGHAISTATVPSGDMTSSGTWAITGAVTRWNAVNDPIGTPDDDTTYINGTAVGTVMFSFPAFSVPTGATIQSVNVYYRTKDVSAGANSLQPSLRVNTTTRTALGVDPGTAYSTWIGTWTTNPNTAAAWTVADVNGTSANPLNGFGFTTTDVTPNVRVTQVYVQVYFEHFNRYWVATAAANWASTSSWSASSGGFPGAGVPTSTHNVVFDGVNSSVGNCDISTAVLVSTLTIQSGYSGTIRSLGASINLSSNPFSMAGGTVFLGTSAITSQGNFLLTGGTLQPNSSTVTFSGGNAQSLRTNGQPLANIVVNKTAATTLSLADQLTTQGHFTVTLGSITTTTSNYGLSIGSDVIVNGGTFVLNSSTMEAEGNWFRTTGVVSPLLSTVTFTGAGNYLIDGGTLNFTNVRFNNAAGNWNLRGPLFAKGYLTLDAGTLDTIKGANSFNITVGSDVISNGGNLDLNASTINVTGSWDWNSGTLVPAASTVTFQGNFAENIFSGGSSFGNVIINGLRSTYTLQDNFSAVGILSVTTGAFNSSGSNFDVTVASDVLINGGTLTLNASMMNVGRHWTRSAGLFNPNSSTVNFDGALRRNINIGAQPFNNVIFNDTNSTTTLTAALFTNGNLTVQSGMFTTGANFNVTVGSGIYLNGGFFDGKTSSMSVAGDWSVTASTSYNGNRSVVTLTGPSNAHLTGSTSFYSLTCVTAGKDLVFEAGSTQYVTNLLTLTGGAGNQILVMSDNPGNEFFLDISTAQTVSYVNAEDSNASGGALIRDFVGGVDSGNNTNWAFFDARRYWATSATGLWNSVNSWSYTPGGATGAPIPTSTQTAVFDGTNGAVGIASITAAVSISTIIVQSAYSGAINTQGFAVTVTSEIVQSAGTIRLSSSAITLQGDLHLTGGTFESNTSTINLTGGNPQTLQTSGDLISNLVVNKTAGTIATLSDQLTTKGQLSVTLGSFTTTSSNYGIDIGSNVLVNGGTFVLNASTMNVQGSWYRTSGTFSPLSSTVSFDGTGRRNINIGTFPFNHVEFNNANATTTLTAALFTTGNLTLQNGMLNTGTNFNITVGSGIYLNGGLFDGKTSTMSVAGDWSVTASTSYNANRSVVTLTGPSNAHLTGSTSFYSLTVVTAGKDLVFQDGSTTSVSNLLTFTGSIGNTIVLQSENPGSQWYFNVSTNQAVTYVNVEDSNANPGKTVRCFTGGVDSGNNNNWAFTDQFRYWVSAANAVWLSSSSWSLASGGTPNASPPISSHTGISDGANGYDGRATVNYPVTLTTMTISSGYTGVVDIASAAFTITSGSLNQTGGTIALGTAPVTIQGQLNLTAGTFVSHSSTITLTGSSTQTITGLSGDLGNLVLNKTAGTVSLGSDVGLDGGFTLTAGTFTTTASNYDLTIASDARVAGGSWYLNGSTISLQGSWVKTAGSMSDMTSTLSLGGNQTQTLTSGTTSFYNLTVNKTGGGITLTSDLDLDGDLTLQSGTFAPGSKIISLDGNWLDTGGTFTATGSTVVFNGATTKTISGNTTFEVLRATTTGTTLKFGNGNTFAVTKVLEFKGTTLQSTTNGSAWLFDVSAASITLLNLSVRDSDASAGVILISTGSTNVSNNTNWDFGQPNAISVFTITQSTYGAAIELDWTVTGDDGATGTLNNSTFTIQYTTDTAFALTTSWSPTAALPAAVYRITIATTGVTAASSQGTRITGLNSGSTYYARIWILDDAELYSPLSAGATNWASYTSFNMTMSTNVINFGPLTAGATSVYTSSITITNTGNVSTNYTLAITTPAIWQPTSGIPVLDQFRLTALFNNAQPLSSDFSVSDDVVMGTTTTATVNNFAINAGGSSVKGLNVEPGEVRYLWFRIENPLMSSTTTQQSIRVIGNAGP